MPVLEFKMPPLGEAKGGHRPPLEPKSVKYPDVAAFNGITYRQERAAAMGPKNSCEYADCAMDKIDKLVNSNNVEHGPQHRPAFWGKLRDDIYKAWLGTVEQLV